MAKLDKFTLLNIYFHVLDKEVLRLYLSDGLLLAPLESGFVEEQLLEPVHLE